MSISKIFSTESPDSRRTITFAAIAGICLVVTGIVEWSRQPAEIEEFGKVGEEFYPDFTDPTRATSLEVYAIDTENVKPVEFRVEQLPNGRWVIPSHHDYPADAEEQLAKTAASIIGVERDAMVTRWESDHSEFQVVNPKQEAFEAGDVEGVGKRIILRGEDDVVLADYIIGQKAETAGGDEEDQYYVRRPNEDEVYIAQLNIDLSTKFVDWVDTELLDVEAMDLGKVTINDYSFDEMRGEITNREVNILHRESSADPWILENLEDETKEVDEDALRETVNTVAGLEIVGVRPKQQGLTPDLKLDRDALQSQNDLNRLQSDLMSKGFLLQPGQSGDPDDLRLLAREGEIAVAANDGLHYQLYFGRAFTGSQEELEIGFSSSDDEGSESEEEKKTSREKSDGEESDSAESQGAKSETDEESEPGESPEEDGEESDSGKPGRYVFLTAEFDKQYLGDEPVKPVEPEMPAELRDGEKKVEGAGPDEKEDASDNEASKTDPDSNQPKKESDAANNNAADEDESEGNDEAAKKDDAAKKEDPLAKMREEYQEAKEEYENKLQQYESDLKEYNEKIEKGKEKAEELNRRFADWYYVIPGESYGKLRLSRDDLIKEKGEEGAKAKAGGAPKMPGGMGMMPKGMPGIKKMLKPEPKSAEALKPETKPATPPAGETEAAKKEASETPKKDAPKKEAPKKEAAPAKAAKPESATKAAPEKPAAEEKPEKPSSGSPEEKPAAKKNTGGTKKEGGAKS